MATVTVKKQNGGFAGSGSRQPLQVSADCRPWDVFAEVGPAWLEPVEFTPAFEVKETPTAVVIKADLPGVDKSDLDVWLAENRLTVAGKREAEKLNEQATFYAHERCFGSFSREFSLPSDLNPDAIEAELHHGVLTIRLPKGVHAAVTPPELGAGFEKPRA